MDEPIRLRRAYDDAGSDDGHRVLVDRLWPRGVRRDALQLDEWCKQVAPSTELRRWYGHDPKRWDRFREAYAAELDGNPEVDRLAGITAEQRLTLVYAAADVAHAHVLVLRDAITAAMPRG